MKEKLKEWLLRYGYPEAIAIIVTVIAGNLLLPLSNYNGRHKYLSRILLDS